jgi:acetyltransferase
MKIGKMDKLFNPDSIAVIGASGKKEKVGHQILKNLLKYNKTVYPINPLADKILGKKTYSSIKDVENKIDLSIIVVPAGIVPQVLKECGEKQIKYAVIISSGFKEISGKGKKLEKEILEIAKKYKIRLIGPNCFGLINTQNNLNTTFSKDIPLNGSISFITQSGALAVAMIGCDQTKDLSFSKIISLGNKTDLDEIDFLEVLEKDPSTKTILIYLEGLNKNKGLSFFRISKKITKSKPIVILKAGTSEEGKKSIASHTGSLAGSNIAYQTAFEQAGIIQANSIKELLNFGKVFSTQPLPKNNKIAIVTNAGGPGVLAVDACSKEKLRLVKPCSKLKQVIPPQVALSNQLDIGGDAQHKRYEKVLKLVLKDKQVGSVLVILTPQAVTEIDKTAQLIVKLKNKNKGLVILTSFIGSKSVNSGIKILEKAGVPNFIEPGEAVHAVAALNKYKRYKQQKETYPKFKINIKKAREIIKNKKSLTQQEIKKLLALYHIPYIKSVSIKNKKELLKLNGLSYPIVLKISHPSILHKTEVGGVVTNIENREELISAFSKTKKVLKKQGIACPNFEIQEMEAGQELIVGSVNDEQFGNLVMFGFGGIYTEVLKDVSFSLAPLSLERTNQMIKKIKTYPVLKGTRNQKPVNLKKVKDILLRVSQMVSDLPIANLDLNPVIANNREVKVVDCKIKIKNKFNKH